MSATASFYATKKLLSTMVFALMVVSLPACSKFHKSTPVNQPAPLVKLASTPHLLTPILNEQGLGSRSAKTSRFGLSTFSKKQKVALQQSPSQFHVAYDTQGYITANPSGVVTATNLQGKTVWQASFKQGLVSGVAVDPQGTTVVISDPYGKLIALDRQTGKQRWQSQLASSVLSPTLVSGNRVISVSNNGVVSANSVQTGELIWQFATQNPNLTVRGGSVPVLLDTKTVLVATADGRVHAINLDDGTPLWSRRMSSAQGASDIERIADIDATPVLDNNRLYVTSYSGQLIAVDLSGRQLMFVKEKDYNSIKPVAVDNSQLYTSTLDGDVIALDKLTGNVAWQSDALRFRGLSNAVSMGNYVLVGDALGYLHLFDKATGKLIDRYEVQGDIAQLQVVGQTVIASSQNGGFSVWQVKG